MSLFAVLGLVAVFLILLQDLPRLPDSLDRLVNVSPTIIYDSEGRILQSLGGREIVTIDRISPHFLQAIISVEDKNFYRHHGMDKVAIVRSFVRGLTSSRRIAGGSTITQQLAKNLFFTFERDITRKLREMMVAVQIEAAFSKDEILEAYCNQIPFGSRSNGVERAARTYFGVPAADLSIAQAALLAGLPNSPSRLNPYSHPDNARRRQLLILSLMEENSYLSPAEREIAVAEELVYQPLDYSGKGSWFVDRVIEECENRFGKDAVYFGGLKIFTTIKPELQVIAENAVRNGIVKLNAKINTDSLQGALMAISPLSGAVWAHVGGVDYRYSQWDRAVDARRRPGSGFKPFLYFTAIDQYGFTPANVILDSLITIPIKGAPDWEVNNFDEVYYGNVILKFALCKSLNSVAARLVAQIGAEPVVNTARRFGVRSRLQPNLSIVLGTSGVSPLDMASAFSVIAAGGEYFPPFFIDRVESPRGEILYEHFIGGNRVADQESIYILLDMMKEVMNSGTAVSARSAGFRIPAAGKTGTTDDYVDSWFTGFTPNLCASVWIGFDLEKPMQVYRGARLTGATGALPIWTDFMLKATEGQPSRDFSIPEGIKFVDVDVNDGYSSYGLNTMTIAVREETVLPAEPEDTFIEAEIEEFQAIEQ